MLWVLAASAITFSACDDDDDDIADQYNAADQNFVMMASMSNAAEIDAGQAASTRGRDTAIVNYGQTMVTEHTDSRSRLQDIADDLDLPAPDSLDSAHRVLKTRLAALTGRAFDSVYIHSQVTDHQAAINLYTTESQNGMNNRLKQYAAEALPALQRHLTRAQAIAARY